MPGVPPVPIPNTAVKPRAANGSWTLGPARVGCCQIYSPVPQKGTGLPFYGGRALAASSRRFNTFLLDADFNLRRRKNGRALLSSPFCGVSEDHVAWKVGNTGFQLSVRQPHFVLFDLDHFRIRLDANIEVTDLRSAASSPDFGVDQYVTD